MSDVDVALAAAHQSDWGRIVAGLIRITGDWAVAEDATQDAFAAAVARWPIDGVPDRPAAWLATAARNRAIDMLRAARTQRSRLELVAIEHERVGEYDLVDDRLRLIFTCCHPALPLAARVALTLRTVAGLSVADIASAFLVPEPTMAQRLVRARRKIAHAGIPYRVPPPELLGERLSGVLAVLYLAFNAGYTTAASDEVATTAISLTEAVVDLMPREQEARGLLALMLFQDSRRPARTDASGMLLTIDEQDRSLWNRAAIERASKLLAATDERGPYVVQALLAQCHAIASSPGDTDWERIVSLYDELSAIAPSPIVRFNRAIAIGAGGDPEAGLALLDELSGELPAHGPLVAARAALLERAGRRSEAAERYREAIALAADDAERAQLWRRLGEVNRRREASPCRSVGSAPM
jgi:RNA polymerase sigma-70 factor (ECF subfamily)